METFFDRSFDAQIRSIQFIEGIACGSVILLSPQFYSLGLLCLEATHDRLNHHALHCGVKDEHARRSAGLLASASMGPVVSIMAACAVWQVLLWLCRHLGIIGGPDPVGASRPWVVLLVQAAVISPFLALFLLVYWRLRKWVKFKWKDVKVPNPVGFFIILSGIGALLLGGYIDADWR
jgi:hypothetical protein